MDLYKESVEIRGQTYHLTILPVELIAKICGHLRVNDIYFLWRSGNYLLNSKISQHTTLSFSFRYIKRPYISWPAWIANFKKLETVSFHHEHSYRFFVEGCDLSVLPDTIRSLQIAFDTTTDMIPQYKANFSRFINLQSLRLTHRPPLTTDLLQLIPPTVTDLWISGDNSSPNLTAPNFVKLLPRALQSLFSTVDIPVNEREKRNLEWPEQLRDLTIAFKYEDKTGTVINLPPNIQEFTDLRSWTTPPMRSADLPRSLTSVSVPLSDWDNLPPNLTSLYMDDVDALCLHLQDSREDIRTVATNDWKSKGFDSEHDYYTHLITSGLMRTLGDMLPASLKELEATDALEADDLGSLPRNLERFRSWSMVVQAHHVLHLPSTLTSFSAAQIPSDAVPHLPKTLTDVEHIMVSNSQLDLSHHRELTSISFWTPKYTPEANHAAYELSEESFKLFPGGLTWFEAPQVIFPEPTSFAWLLALKLSYIVLHICPFGVKFVLPEHWSLLPKTLVSLRVAVAKKSWADHKTIVPAMVIGLEKHHDLRTLRYPIDWNEMMTGVDPGFLAHLAPNIVSLELPVPKNLDNNHIAKLPRSLYTLQLGGTAVCSINPETLNEVLPPGINDLMLPASKTSKYVSSVYVKYKEWTWNSWNDNF